MGSRLLQKLGWKEGSSYAYVPSYNKESERMSPSTGKSDSTEAPNTSQLLSQRRIRRIKMQQSTIQIPTPKMNQVGLGFQAHKDAPEFADFFAKRRRKAQQRAQGNQQRSVYRISNLLSDDKHAEDTSTNAQSLLPEKADQADQAHYEAYEVMEDFVGTRTVGGFALRDDEDDAFDDHTGKNLTRVSDKVLLDKEEYNTVIDDPRSDDEDQDNIRSLKSSHAEAAADLSEGFSAFADALISHHGTSGEPSPAATVTMDGRPPLPGFALGVGKGRTVQRFRGPDVPRDYDEQVHVFREEEHPLVWQALTRAVQLENDDARKRAAVKGALASRRVEIKKEPSRSVALAGTTFVSLSSAMKDRFTSGSTDKQGDQASATGTALPAGLISADALPKAVPPVPGPAPEPEIRRNLLLTQTTQSFVPEPLLCKRFGVRVPILSSTALIPREDAKVSQEESFFHEQVLAAAQSTQPSQPSVELDDTSEAVNILANRPPTAVYESIFGTFESEEEKTTTGSDTETRPTMEAKARSNLFSDQQDQQISTNVAVAETLERKDRGRSVDWRSSNTSSEESSEEREPRRRSSERRKRKKKERKRKEKKRRRKRDRSEGKDAPKKPKRAG